MEVCGSVLQALTLFQTKICNFQYPFSDPGSRIHTHFCNSIPVFRLNSDQNGKNLYAIPDVQNGDSTAIYSN